MRSLYVEGDSPLHRLAPRTKLIGLFAFAALLFSSGNAWLAGAGAVVAGLSCFSIGLPPGEALTRIRPLLATIALFGIFGFLVSPPEQALPPLLRMAALMLAAAAVTATTRISAFMDEVAAACRPLERLGLVNAGDIGLAFGLALRFLPEIMARHAAIAEAQRARGLKPHPVRMLAPLIVLTLKEADNIAAAIDARGIRRP